MFDDDYAEHRFTSGLLLDLMHHFPGSGVDAELRQALNYRDPRLKHTRRSIIAQERNGR